MFRGMLLAASLVAATWPGAATAAAAAWQEASSAHFVVYSDDKAERIKAFTERLEKFDRVLRLLRDIPEAPVPDADRVRVYMTGNIYTIARLAGGQNVAGFYVPRVGGPVAFVPRDAPKGSVFDLDAQSILFHEYTHHFMFTTYPDSIFPAWLVEGFAEFNATAIFEQDGSVTIGQLPGYRARSLTDSTTLSAKKLVQLSPGKLTMEQRLALYARGWLLTHFLTFEPTRQGQLSSYITAINAGKNADSAASVFGDIWKLDRDMTDYVLRSKIKAARIKSEAITIGPVTLRPLTAGEAAVMPARLQSARGVDKEGAQTVVKLARKLAAPYPDDAGAQNELAEAEYDAGNFDAADMAASRALAADPKSMHALVYKGMAAAARLAQAKDKDTAHWRSARQWFVQANALDPDNPEPLMLFYTSFVTGGLTPTRNAEDGLLTAYRQAPFAFNLRLTAAGILLHRGDGKAARVALLPIAYSPHRAGKDVPALRALTAIDAGDIKAAAAILDEPDDASPKNGG